MFSKEYTFNKIVIDDKQGKGKWILKEVGFVPSKKLLTNCMN
jgi:hypothetical protein